MLHCYNTNMTAEGTLVMLSSLMIIHKGASCTPGDPWQSVGVRKTRVRNLDGRQVEMLNHYTSVFLSHVGFNSLQESLMAGAQNESKNYSSPCSVIPLR